MEVVLPILVPPVKKKETFPRSPAADFPTSLIGQKVAHHSNAPWHLGHCPGTQNYLNWIYPPAGAGAGAGAAFPAG